VEEKPTTYNEDFIRFWYSEPEWTEARKKISFWNWIRKNTEKGDGQGGPWKLIYGAPVAGSAVCFIDAWELREWERQDPNARMEIGGLDYLIKWAKDHPAGPAAAWPVMLMFVSATKEELYPPNRKERQRVSKAKTRTRKK